MRCRRNSNLKLELEAALPLTGLKNSSRTFQRVIYVILSTARWQYALVYLDDSFVFSQSLEEHKTYLWRVLSLFATAGVTLKLNKFLFFADTIRYFGHEMWSGRLYMFHNRTNSIRVFKDPTTIRKLKSFLSNSNLFRRFVLNFALIAEPLNYKIRKDQPENFGTLN